MISFEMTEEQEVVQQTLRGFAAQELRPIARACDEASSIADDVLERVWELGLTSTQIPEAYGGGGEPRSPVTNAIVLEELAHGDATLALAAVAPSLFANALVDLGSEAQKKELLPLFCGSKYHAASLALVEPAALFDPARLRTVAEPKGDRFVLSGTKSFVPMGARASHFLVFAALDGRPEAFIVKRDAEGLLVKPNEKNMGLRALETSTLELVRVEVPAEARLGGAAGCDVRRLVDASRVALAAVLVGVSRAVLEYCVPYAKDREAFDEAIARKQAIAFCLAEMHMEVEACRWMVWKAASELEHGLSATRSAHLARTYVAEKALWIADNGIQVLGGHGFIREHPVEMWFRNARTLGVLEGTVTV